MSILADQITIAVTVYSRRQYISQAVRSALNQSVPVRVMVMEDCGPDAMLEAVVKAEFGSSIEYIRNPRRRGLFGNWNACLDACATEWLSILHDDDYLAPDFVASMIEVERQAPGCALYYGRTLVVDEGGQGLPEYALPPVDWRWRRAELNELLWGTPFPFPGHLMNVAETKKVGGFRETSYYCGDWEMWAKLFAAQGAAQTSNVVAYNRSHPGGDKGGNVVFRSGLLLPNSLVQHKRVLALLGRHGGREFDRKAYLKNYPVPTRFLLRYGVSLSSRLLRYHLGLLRLSKPPNLGYAVFQRCAGLGGVPFVRLASMIWNRISHIRFTRQYY